MLFVFKFKQKLHLPSTPEATVPDEIFIELD